MNENALLDAILREDFASFTHRSFQLISQGNAFQPNWHLQAMAYQLARLRDGETTRLIVTVPPRSLKSITISVAWVAWMLGHDPKLRFVCVSYSAELSLKHARDCRAVMQSDWYRRIFPGTILSRERNAEHDFQTTRRGGRLSTSVGGTLTGRGGDIIVIDDPIKPDEAMSELARTNVIEWFSNTLLSRLNDKQSGAIVLVMQRLHEADLAGFLLEKGGWDELKLPAIAEIDEAIPLGRGRIQQRRVGDVLHSAREPMAKLEELRGAMGSAVFSAQYQQAPIPADGAMIERAWLSKRYNRKPEKQPGDRIVQSWDCASKEGLQNDYSVCLTVLVRKRDVYVLDVYRARVDFPKLHRQAITLARVHGANAILIEDTASGTPLLQHLWSDQPQGVPRPIRRRPEGDKKTRMFGECSRIEAGELILPENASWLADFERELLGFPNTRHDDQVDALSQLLNWLARRIDIWDLQPLDRPIVGPIVFSRHGGGDTSPWGE
jgi:predicted phage terminase large subunit-like protein